MPNQLNYPNPIKTTEFQRPSRILSKDDVLIPSESHEVLFGTHPKDHVEIWVYNPDGSFAGHTKLDVSSAELTLATVVDESGVKELLNVDMNSAARLMGLAPGRYAMVFSFLRDEVGSENGYKLYISDISTDRTEVKLQCVDTDALSKYDLREFTVPSVPRKYAQALMDQVFGKSIDAQLHEKVTPDKVLVELNQIHGNTTDRINFSNSLSSYNKIISTIVNRAHTIALNKMDEDKTNLAVQELELLNYIGKAVDDVIYGMKQSGEIDPRFYVIE
ncbi:MAG: hypothetical protein KY428_09010 [Bacteroidetes bacterium]|nr:hypothetical protein [Bacteroidota bacterium]